MKIIQIIKTLSGNRSIPATLKQYFTEPNEKIDYIHLMGLADDGKLYERRFKFFIDVPSSEDMKKGAQIIKGYKWTDWECIDK